MKDVKSRVARWGAVALAFSAPMAAFAAADVNSALSAAEGEILSTVATFGAILIGVAAAGVGWRVGAKLLKRLSGAA